MIMLSFYCFSVPVIVLTLVRPSLTSVNTYQNALITQPNKNSGQYQISQLCSQRSPFPITRRVEGATLSSGLTDMDLNCTVTFRTKSAQQHFVIRFEELKLSCNDHLVLFDGDLDYGQQSIKDFSCRDNMASTPILKTTGTFLTMRYSSEGSQTGKPNDGFRLVVTATFDGAINECPSEYVFCHSPLCISRSLFCDGVNHCLDNSDELNCNGPDDVIELNYVLGFFVMLILIIATGVCVCVVLHCRRDQSPYSQYQHHLQRALGVPLQTSSSLMFAHQQQPQYQFFQPANVSPYVTPQHLPQGPNANHHHQQQQQQQQAAAAAALFATLPRGYSTLPLNMVGRAGAGPHNLQQAQTILTSKPANASDLAMLANHQQTPREYLMMAGLGGPQLSIQPSSYAMALAAGVGHGIHQPQNLTSSQSILSTAMVNAANRANSSNLNRGQQRHTTGGGGGGGAASQVGSNNGMGTLRELSESGQ